MKKRIFAQIVCAILLFLTGLAFGDYREAHRFVKERNVADLNWYIAFHMQASHGEYEKVKRTSEMCINMAVQSLREIESGAPSYSYWLHAFSLGTLGENPHLDDKFVNSMLKALAEYPITDVPGLTEENLAYLKSKRE